MAKIVTLKNPDGETIYPVTKSEAVDGSELTSGVATINTTYLSGSAYWHKYGKLVIANFVGSVDVAMPGQAHVTGITGLPKSSRGAWVSATGADWNTPNKEFFMQIDTNGTEIYFSWPPSATARQLVFQLIYFTD
jgi:hypothetical protein